MSDILNTYPVFEPNQVLSSTQLNNLVNYLDQQNRLTRARLIGMGVVCGLEIKYDKSEHTITITKGTGITSEGYLIALGDCITVKYRPYLLPPGTIYEPFVDSDNKQDISLFELLSENVKAGKDDKTLDDETFLADKVVLLFIESFDKDLKSCLGKNCDELGKERILTIRKLLISKSDLQKVWNRTNTGKLDAVFPEKFGLPVINLPRVLFSPDQNNSKNYTDFSKNYTGAVLSVFDKLVAALSQTYDIYRPLLIESYNEKNPFENTPVTTKLAKLNNFLNNTDATLTSYLGVQYVYDLFQDLILAYNEFKNTAFDLMSECCPDMTRFPKHLMLGEAIPPLSTICNNSEYRHLFVQPPVYNLQKLLVQKTIALHNRLVLMLESFDLKRINGFKGADGKSFPVRITPSLEKTTLLSQRSVPWYYDLKKKSSYPALGTLKNYWNFDVSRKCTDEKDGLALDYENQSNDQSVAKDKLSTPLFYDIQDYSFLRIEGQIGVDFNVALQKINDLKARFNLPFNTVALQLDTNAGSVVLDYRCGFEDIQEEYKILKLSFCRFVKDFREIYKFFDENQNEIFGDNTDVKPSEYLKKISAIVEILAALCKSLEDCIEKFDFFGFQKLYKELLDRVLEFVLVDLELLNKINISTKEAEKQVPLINGLIQRLAPVGFKLIDLMFYNRFLRLYYSFKRREFYLKKSTAVFSENIRKHPGIDHQSGVPKGGTFILVYINTSENGVIADFSLPYLCCTKENCVPACDNKEDGFVFEMEPFARPDYAITLVKIPVEIDVMRNDFHLFGGEFKIESEKTSRFDGRIEQISDTALRYYPKEEFAGTDSFTYALTDIKTGNTDKATVTVIVKKPVQVQGCYSIEILQCWGDEAVKDTVGHRELDPSSGANMFEVLLNDLRKTGGFTELEIKSNVLESEQRRRNLLNCLGIPVDANTSYEQLGQLILEYQKKNCGAVQPAAECYSAAVLQCWGDTNVNRALKLRGISATGDVFNTLLESLRQTHGFTQDQLQKLGDQALLQLINCLQLPIPTDKKPVEIILEYQSQNCQGAANPAVAVEPGLIAVDDMVKVLKARGVAASATEPRSVVESKFLASNSGKNLSESELILLSDDTITNIANNKSITRIAGEEKSQLIKRLLK